MGISAFSVSKKTTSKVKRLQAGVYDSIVESVCEAEEYAPGKAFRVRYQLVSEKGEKYSFEELFYNERWNDRTQEFYDYIEENGFDLDNLESLVGFKETLDIRKSTSGRYNMTIVDREPKEEP